MRKVYKLLAQIHKFGSQEVQMVKLLGLRLKDKICRECVLIIMDRIRGCIINSYSTRLKLFVSKKGQSGKR